MTGKALEKSLRLPDESRYPAELTCACELLECFSAADDAETLLVRERDTGALYVAKCFFPGHPLFERADPDALKALDAPPLPRFIAEYKSAGARCVVREYVPGETLAALAARRTFSEAETAAVGVQLCDQLTALHSLKPPVIHRDIKPQNVILRPDGRAVLIDFGNARAYSDNETDTIAFGTQGFAPPEQYGFSQTDARSDIYSLGVLLRWMLCGQTAAQPEKASPLGRVIGRCAAFDPQKRYATARQVKTALLQTNARIRRHYQALCAVVSALLLAVLAAVIVPIAGRAHGKPVFTQPLIEQAARLQLALDDDSPLTDEMLSGVEALYIVADQAYPDADSFYAAVNRWYAAGRPGRGTIASLEDLRRFPNLREVCVAAQEIANITPLSELELLSKVELKHNDIADISPLAGLRHLISVGINGNPVRDITPLLQCPSLAFLDLCDVQNYRADVIGELGNFDFLDISNATDSYNYLGGKSILSLRLGWTGLTSLEALRQVTRLEELDISHTAVTDLAPLRQHAGLKVLRLTALPVDDLSVLLDLPQLQRVTVSRDMEPLLSALGELPFAVEVE